MEANTTSICSFLICFNLLTISVSGNMPTEETTAGAETNWSGMP
jgi:hypothetical protein